MARRPEPVSLTQIARIAEALGPLAEQVVFIGGAIAPLLQTDPMIPHVRPTTDVDAIVASTDYAAHHSFEASIEVRGFRRQTTPAVHAHRWLAPDGTPFDVVPAGDHLGASGNEWDHMAVQTAVNTEVRPGLHVRHVSAMGFLALKWAAFEDRGARDPYASADLEDILALIVTRPAIVQEFRSAPVNMQRHVCAGLRRLSDDAAIEDLIAAHLSNAHSFRAARSTLLDRVTIMLQACESDTTP